MKIKLIFVFELNNVVNLTNNNIFIYIILLNIELKVSVCISTVLIFFFLLLSQKVLTVSKANDIIIK